MSTLMFTAGSDQYNSELALSAIKTAKESGIEIASQDSQGNTQPILIGQLNSKSSPELPIIAIGNREIAKTLASVLPDRILMPV